MGDMLRQFLASAAIDDDPYMRALREEVEALKRERDEALARLEGAQSKTGPMLLAGLRHALEAQRGEIAAARAALLVAAATARTEGWQFAPAVEAEIRRAQGAGRDDQAEDPEP